jgi:hypothetical protein
MNSIFLEAAGKEKRREGDKWEMGHHLRFEISKGCVVVFFVRSRTCVGCTVFVDWSCAYVPRSSEDVGRILETLTC